MTKEELIQAISDDKMMPFIQPEQLAGIVDFVIKNYRPSLPSNLDEAAIRVANEMEIPTEQSQPESLTLVMRHIAARMFKAGAEWMAGHGVSMMGKVGIYGVDVETITEELREAGFKLGEEVILQIRKKQ